MQTTGSKGELAMKRILLSLTTVMMTAAVLFGQTFVAPGEGTLSAAIASAQSGDVLQLAAGGIYIESADAELTTLVDKEITIETEDFGTDKAIVRMGLASDDETSVTFFEIGNNAGLTLNGIEFDGGLNGSPNVTYLVSLYAGPDDALSDAFINKIHIEDCYIHDLTSFVVAASSPEFAGFAPDITVVADTTIINNSILENTGTTIYYKYAGCNYVQLTRSTLNGVGPYGLRISGPGETQLWSPDYSPVVLIDQTTWYNIGWVEDPRETIQGEKGPLNRPWTVSNSIFVKQISKDRTTINIKDTPQDAGATIRSLCWFDVGAINFREHSVVDTINMDPEFTDAENGDFTLPAGSMLQTYASHGGAIGDPRWAASPVSVDDRTVAASIALKQNYPNPFNPTTSIDFYLANAGHVIMQVHDLNGRLVTEIMNQDLSAGSHNIHVDLSNQPAGIYFYSLRQNSSLQSRKMLLIK